MRDTIEKLSSGKDLSQEQSQTLFSRLVSGEVDPVQIAALLIALKSKGETPEEIIGAVHALKEAAVGLNYSGPELVDTCGTGGDRTNTVNISTAVALIAAEAGLRVAKHGNRSVSSRCGSADVLEACGIKIEGPPQFVIDCLNQLNIAFLYAPNYHPALFHVGPTRTKLGVRTIFNLLGPLLNPLQPDYQITGVYDPDLCLPVARVLQRLGVCSALVVHGGGMDEIALHSHTKAVYLDKNSVHEMTITPEQFGFERQPLGALQGGGVQQNKNWLQTFLAGKGSKAHNHAVALNAGALFWVARKTADLETGVEEALAIIESGQTAQRLSAWGELSHGA